MSSGGESRPPRVRCHERFGTKVQNFGVGQFSCPEHGNNRGPQNAEGILGNGRRSSNSQPASREWRSHSQEPCRTSDVTCLRHRWRQRVRVLTKKEDIRFGCPLENGAGDEARTRYLHLGKVALYQMSYARRTWMIITGVSHFVNCFSKIYQIYFSASGFRPSARPVRCS